MTTHILVTQPLLRTFLEVSFGMYLEYIHGVASFYNRPGPG